MGYPDIIILIPLLYGAYKGFSKGFVMELSILIALIAGVWGSMKFSALAAVFLRNQFHLSEGVLSFVSFLSVFLAILIAVVLVAKMIEGFLDLTALGILNKIAGAVFGMLKWAFILMVVLYFFMPLDERFHFFSPEKIKQSYVFGPLKSFSQSVLPFMKGVIAEGADKLMDKPLP